jgi:hypothetical protein
VVKYHHLFSILIVVASPNLQYSDVSREKSETFYVGHGYAAMP